MRYKESYNPFVDYPQYNVIDLETSQEAKLYDHYWAVIPLSRFEGEAADFIQMPIAIAAMAAVAAAASLIPARRASKLDPMIALREE